MNIIWDSSLIQLCGIFSYQSGENAEANLLEKIYQSYKIFDQEDSTSILVMIISQDRNDGFGCCQIVLARSNKYEGLDFSGSLLLVEIGFFNTKSLYSNTNWCYYKVETISIGSFHNAH